MRAIFLAVALSTLSAASAFCAPAQRYAAVLEGSFFSCTAYSGPFSASGNFSRYSVEAFLDLDELTNSRVLVILDATSIVSDFILLPDTLLRRLLQPELYPVAVLQTKAIRATSKQGVYEADVVLSLLGETNDKTIMISFAHEGQDVRISGTIDIELVDGRCGVESYSILLRKASVS